MRTSKSSVSFQRNADGADREQLRRPRARSSLDTFLIPGRTRLPSSKTSVPDPVDLQITQGLLNSESFKAPKKSANHVDKPASWFTSEHDCSIDRDQSSKGRLKVNGRGILIVSPSPKPRCKKPPKPQANNSREAIGMPAPSGGSGHSAAPLIYGRMTSQSGEQGFNPFDGPFDSGPGSLPTSGTWSTISNRIFSDSSGASSFRGTQEFVDEYNRLALKHGLPRLTEAPVHLDIAKVKHTDVKVTSKSHNNWLMRKILRRTSSSYNIKVKTKDNHLSRKLSVSSISDRNHKDVLKDKSLEEIGRLGGLSILVLPPEFAVDKLVLPTCLSATATYLSQHGRTTPGVFRVPGQQNTINALYDYYAHQFSSADSISDQVQQTVGSGLLPTHIPHSVHDVASVFKKMLAGLPGGILGSISLFKALRGIADHLHSGPDLSESQQIQIRARLIALAISSVTSVYRVFLICAVLGLAGLIGHEAEKAETAEKTAGTDGERHRRASFELMGYRSLGVVLGPLLLGDLTDEVGAGDETERGELLVIPDNPKKRRKEKRKEKVPDKLEQNADLIAHVDRANVTAKVMEMLISNWHEVVKQMRNINAMGPGRLSARAESRKRLASADNTLTMEASEEELLFDFLRGRPLPDDFKGSLKVKKKVRISTRSPTSHRAIWPTDSSESSRHSKARKRATSQESAAKGTAVGEVRQTGIYTEVGNAKRELPDIPRGESTELFTYTDLASPEERRLILQHPFTSHSLEHRIVLKSHDNSAEALETKPSLQSSTYQCIDGYSMPHADPSNIAATEVPTTTSYPGIEDWEAKYKRDGQPLEQEAVDERRTLLLAREKDQMLTNEVPEVDIDPTKQSHAGDVLTSPPASQNLIAGEPRLSMPVRQISVRQLAQRFGTATPSPHRKAISLDSSIHKVSTYTRPPSADNTPQASPVPHQLPSQSSTTDKPANKSDHDSRIPKPVHEQGRGRKTVTRSPSPNREGIPFPPLTLLHKRSSVFNILPDSTAATTTTTIPQRTTSRSLSPTRNAIPATVMVDSTPRRVNSMGPIRTPELSEAPKLGPLSPRARVVLSAESLRRVRAAPEEPPVAQRLPPRRISVDRSSSHSNAPLSRSLSTSAGSPRPLSHPATATNATLYAEIRRLQRLLDQKGEETTQARRSLDAVREAREQGKGTLSEELREARRECRGWRNRAEWAEGRLLGWGRMTGDGRVEGEEGREQEDGGRGEMEGESNEEGRMGLAELTVQGE